MVVVVVVVGGRSCAVLVGLELRERVPHAVAAAWKDTENAFEILSAAQ